VHVFSEAECEHSFAGGLLERGDATPARFRAGETFITAEPDHRGAIVQQNFERRRLDAALDPNFDLGETGALGLRTEATEGTIAEKEMRLALPRVRELEERGAAAPFGLAGVLAGEKGLRA